MRRRQIRGDSGDGEAEPGRQRRRHCGIDEVAEAVMSRARPVAATAVQFLSWEWRRRHKDNGGGSERGVRKTDVRRTGSGRGLEQTP